MKLIPVYDATAPITCTASGDEVAGRIEAIERLHVQLAGIDRTQHGLVLHFSRRDDIEADVRRFAVDEKGCCSFWGFEVEVTDDEVRLHWDGPPAVAELVDRLQAHFEGAEPLTSIDGLL